MGFLDHSTNNIIIDAVLTDLGRNFLSRNDGSFAIKYFALGDDEIDYTIIEQFGRTIGKEKIEKNTPIFEAQTDQNIALKHKLIGISNPTLTKLPLMTLTGDGLDTAGTSIAFKRTGSGSSREITFRQEIQDELTIFTGLYDNMFIVKLPNRFLELSIQPDVVDNDNIAHYLVTADSTSTDQGGARLILTIRSKTISDSVFTTFGNSDNKNKITSVMSVKGYQSGIGKEIQVTIEK